MDDSLNYGEIFSKRRKGVVIPTAIKYNFTTYRGVAFFLVNKYTGFP